ncbi:MAG: type II toxin-antitoxin system VapC family toxin [Chloroflexi bacterium]|nr:type II toxin-antitoxin system VapC family toxin [Chloroflexota bacterium]
MILVDANILIHATTPSSPAHDLSRTWLDAQLSAGDPVGLPWQSLLAFVRIKSNSRLVQFAAPVAEVWALVEEWLDCPGVWIPGPTERHRAILTRLMLGHPLSAHLVPDAHLAALAIEHGLLLCSSDGDFARFGTAGLRWENPILTT